MRKKIGEQIYVRLRNQTSIEGKLVAYDEHLNMMIQNLKITKEKEVQEKNLMYLRGDTVMLVGRI